ncbi:MAG: sodium/solute symporter [Deltaproteobacteria bacterium]|nr:sodium/solute symporter [Deltaproteobacteria bacterium]
MQTIDYIILLLYLCGILLIRVRLSGRTAAGEDFFLAGRSMHWFPVGLSVMTTAFNAINYTAFSGEVFGNGLYILLCLPVFVVVSLPVTRVIMPFYHRLGVCSVYEYLEKRFDARVRILAGGLFIVWRIFWMATALYIPAVVLAKITGLNPVFLTLISGAVVTAYTTGGGIRGVMWTDVFQFFVLLRGLVFGLFVVISQIPGGFGAILQIAAGGSLLKPFYPMDPAVFSFDPHIRISLWSCWLGTLIAFMSRYSVDQTVVQRYFTARSLHHARIGFRLNYIVAVVTLLLLAFFGIAIYVHALENGTLGKLGNRPVAYFADFVGALPTGMTGLIVAGLLAASMSSVDSGINSCCAVFVTDFFNRFGVSKSIPDIVRNKVFSAFFGLTATVAALSVGRLGSIFEIANKVINGLGSPLLAIFVLGMFSRRANSNGVLWGGLSGALISIYISFNVTRLALHYYAVVNLLVTLAAAYVFSFYENRAHTEPTDRQLRWTWKAVMQDKEIQARGSRKRF